jgi:hypothetical protein
VCESCCARKEREDTKSVRARNVASKWAPDFFETKSRQHLSAVLLFSLREHKAQHVISDFNAEERESVFIYCIHAGVVCVTAAAVT